MTVNCRSSFDSLNQTKRDDLQSAIDTDDRIVTDRTVDPHIKSLRKKLADTKPGFDPARSVYAVRYRYDPS